MQNPTAFFSHSLTAFAKIIDKAEAHATAKNIKPEVIPQLRLIADMLPMWRQVTIACDHAKGACARLAAMENPSFADTETTLAELKDRITRTLAFIASIPADAYEGAENRTITLKVGPHERSFPAVQYYHSFAVPNFYFHMTTAYAILRANGVDLGKSDFMGA